MCCGCVHVGGGGSGGGEISKFAREVADLVAILDTWGEGRILEGRVEVPAGHI